MRDKNPTDTDLDARPGAALDDDDVVIKPRSKWPLLLFIAALLGGGGFLAWRALNTVDLLKVLVVVDFDGQWYDGSKSAARLADGLNERLQSLGFTPVRAGDPEVVAVLEKAADPVSAARKLGAAWVVSGKIKTEAINHPIGEGYTELRAAGTIAVQHVEDAEPTLGDIAGWTGARDDERARQRLSGDQLGRQLARVALPAIVLHPRIQEKLTSSADTAGQLQPARQFVADQGSQVRVFNDTYAALATRRAAAEKGDPKPKIERAMSSEDGLCGAGPKGALIKTADIKPYVSERKSAVRYTEDLESLAWVAPDGKTETLWRGYNVYGYPGVSDDGRVVALVEDLFGWAKTVTVVVEGGTPNRLRLDPEKRFSSLKPSADGSRLAMYEQACRRCDSDLVVLNVADGKEVLRLAHGTGRFDGLAWINGTDLMVLNVPGAPETDTANDDAGDEGSAAEGGGDDEATDGEGTAGDGTDGEGTTGDGTDGEGTDGEDPAKAGAESDGQSPGITLEGPERAVWRVPTNGAAPTRLLTLTDAQYLSWPAVDPKGERAVFAAQIDDASAVAILNFADGSLRHLAFEDGPVEHPVFSPDGQHLAFTVGRSTGQEITVTTTELGPARALTQNRVRDRYPRFSADGTRIWFETLDEDPNFPRARTVVVLASVPFSP